MRFCNGGSLACFLSLRIYIFIYIFLLQEKEELELKLNEANSRINSLVGELDYLRSQLGASPNDKEVKIVDLTRKVILKLN